MRCLAWIAVAVFLMAGCGANPLLKIAAADYAPFRVGSEWNYVDLSGAAAFTCRVISSTKVGSVDVFSISNFSGIPGTSLVAGNGSSIQIVSPFAQTDRKLPYIIGNRWDLAPISASVTQRRTVDGYENLVTPAGSFTQCFRLKTEIFSYNSGTNVTTTTGTFIWIAPNVGDVQYADIDAAGISVTTAKLGSYSLGQ